MVKLFLLFALHGQNIVLLYEVIAAVCGGIMTTLVGYDDCRKNPRYMVTYLQYFIAVKYGKYSIAESPLGLISCFRNEEAIVQNLNGCT